MGSILDEIAARKTEIVDQTPFGNFNDNLLIKVIDKRLNALYKLIRRLLNNMNMLKKPWSQSTTAWKSYILKLTNYYQKPRKKKMYNH